MNGWLQRAQQAEKEGREARLEADKMRGQVELLTAQNERASAAADSLGAMLSGGEDQKMAAAQLIVARNQVEALMAEKMSLEGSFKAKESELRAMQEHWEGEKAKSLQLDEQNKEARRALELERSRNSGARDATAAVEA